MPGHRSPLTATTIAASGTAATTAGRGRTRQDDSGPLSGRVTTGPAVR
ncbi:hypothetical protein [Streptosporangium sp. NPDC002524]